MQLAPLPELSTRGRLHPQPDPNPFKGEASTQVLYKWRFCTWMKTSVLTRVYDRMKASEDVDPVSRSPKFIV